MPAFALLTVALLLWLGAACARRQDACGDASTTSAELAAPVWTRTPSPSPPPPDEPAEAPAPRATAERATAEQVSADAAPRPLEPNPLPAWVPDAGRLTIIQASDLTRNLGIETVTGDAEAPSSGAPR